MTEQDDLQDELEDTAYHEACHFVMGLLAKGGLPRGVSIVHGSDYAGFCGGAPGMPEYAALVYLAGVFAEEVINAGDLDRARDDLEAAENKLRQVHGDGWESHQERYLECVYRVLSYTGPRRAILAVASYLVENPILELEAVYPLHDLALRSLGNRRRWLCAKVDAFLAQVKP